MSRPTPNFFRRLWQIFFPDRRRHRVLPDEHSTGQESLLSQLRRQLTAGVPAEELEKWYVNALRLSSATAAPARLKTAARRKSGSASTVFLANTFGNSHRQKLEARQGFLLLKETYARSGNAKSALRMLRLACVFGGMTSEERIWALKEAAAAGIAGGYWSGEAAVHFAEKKDSLSRSILERAAQRGDKFSELVLACI